jgi:hypothetical protein
MSSASAVRNDSTVTGESVEDALDTLENTSFLISLHNLNFEVMGSLKEIGEKYISISITASDDLSKIGSLQKAAKEQLRGKAKKVVVLPSPITVEEYSKVKEVLQRLEVRRSRRSR